MRRRLGNVHRQCIRQQHTLLWLQGSISGGTETPVLNLRGRLRR
jgi:hypothetical protein